jgi:hypothetical protein
MIGTYKYKISFERLQAVSHLLAKHYGLGAGYFLRDRIGDTDFVELGFPCSYDNFLDCFKSERVFINKDSKIKNKKFDLPNTPENSLVIDAIWLIINICTRENFVTEKPKELEDAIPSEEDFDCDDDFQEFMIMNGGDLLCNFYEDAAFKDLLELYIYHKQKARLKDYPTQLTIK